MTHAQPVPAVTGCQEPGRLLQGHAKPWCHEMLLERGGLWSNSCEECGIPQPAASGLFTARARAPPPEGTPNGGVWGTLGSRVSALGLSAHEPEEEPLMHTVPFTRNPSGPPWDFQAAACGWGQRQMMQRPKPECGRHRRGPAGAPAPPSRGSQAPPAPAAQQSMSSGASGRAWVPWGLPPLGTWPRARRYLDTHRSQVRHRAVRSDAVPSVPAETGLDTVLPAPSAPGELCLSPAAHRSVGPHRRAWWHVGEALGPVLSTRPAARVWSDALGAGGVVGRHL